MAKKILLEINARTKVTEDVRYVFLGDDGKPKKLNWDEMDLIDAALKSYSLINQKEYDRD